MRDKIRKIQTSDEEIDNCAFMRVVNTVYFVFRFTFILSRVFYFCTKTGNLRLISA